MNLHNNALVAIASAMLMATTWAPRARADVVINEIFYHAPDDLTDLQWIELHNTGADPVSLTGWKLAKGVDYAFTAEAVVPAGGYVVVCRSRSRFAEFYNVAVAGEFAKSLKRGGDELDLRDAAGKVVDHVKFSDGAPWPRAADGESASLERICPAASGDGPENWAASVWASDGKIPGGTPGERNGAFSEVLPPVVTVDAKPPGRVRPDEPIRIEANVRDALALREVSLRYTVVGPGGKGEEVAVPMTAAGNGPKYTASVPAQKDGTVIRLRVHAANERGAARFYPAENDPQPAMSVLVQGPVTPGKIPLAFLINVDASEVSGLAGQGRPREVGDRPQGPPPEMVRMMVERQLRSATDLSPLWASLTLGEKQQPRNLEKLRDAFVRLETERTRLAATTAEAAGRGGDPRVAMGEVAKSVTAFKQSVREAAKPLLEEAELKLLDEWAAAARPDNQRDFGRDPLAILRAVVSLEPAYYHVTMMSDATQFNAVRDAFRQAVAERDGLAPELGRLMAPPAGSEQSDAREEFQAKVEALESGVEKKLRAVLRPQQAREFAAWRAKQSNGFGPPKSPKHLPGTSALVYVDPRAAGEPKLFDFVQVTQRSGGFKVRLGKGQQLDGYGVLNFVYGPDPRHQLAEPLAFELHRRVGSPTYLSDYVRVSLDGRPVGYHYLFSQPNRRLLAKLGFGDDGNLYKALWTGRGLAGQHVKKTNPHTGHDDLIQLVDELQRTKSDPAAQWELIRREFAVEPLLNHYAVRLLISDWDGFFNNFYLYHDSGKTKKWYFLPWDEDKTWGGYDGSGLLVDLPTTYGAEGDRPPGGVDRGFGGSWWRAGGYISRPVLANPSFRSLYLARVKELLNTEFTEAKLLPLIDQYRDRLHDEVAFRASAGGEDPERALEQFERNIASLKEFVTKRREWLLAQEEIRSAAASAAPAQPPKEPAR